VPENIALINIFGPKKDEVRKSHNEEFRNLYSSLCVVRIMTCSRLRLTGHVARIESRSAYRILVGILESVHFEV
jgi:hypothetical protein